MVTDIEYALMAGRAYQSTRAAINLLPDLQAFGWTEFFLQQQPSGFEAISFQKGTDIVISFAGTGTAVDWWANAGGFFGVTSEQLTQAAEYYLQVKAANPTATISFAGHSLGGGLASLMAVFFGETATTFDQAPFRNSASASVASSLYLLLTQQGYSETALQGLANFISAPASVGIPNESNVHDISVQGEILSAASGFRIGTATSLTHGAPDLLMAISLHSQALLSAFVQNNQFREVTFTLPDVVRMIFSDDLYNYPTSGENENFIERLVRHQNGIAGLAAGEAAIPADGMLTRFTSDLMKIAQAGGLTLTNTDISKTLIAFAMQMYYENTANAVSASKTLFTEVTGGVQFDRADVAATLDDAKGYNLYFQNYLASNAFTNTERQLIQSLLPILRDWYVQAGSGGMTAADIQNRGAFMLGGSRTDALIGGSQADLLIGNAGADRLTGGGGNDTLLGGAGFDLYYYQSVIDGHDTIEDSDARGAIVVNGQVLTGDVKRAGQADWTSSNGTIHYRMSGTDLIVELNGTQIMTVNENFESGQFGIRLIDAQALPAGLPTISRTIEGDHQPKDFNPDPEILDERVDDLGNYIYDPGAPQPWLDILRGSGGNDRIDAGEMRDYLLGFGGDDVLVGGAGNDRLLGGDGN